MTCRTLEEFYHINGRSFEKQYKETLSGYRSWNQLSHAQKWLLFEDNIGKNIAIDETSLSNGELYTIITNRDKHGKQGCLVAIVAGTKSLDVCKVLDKIDEKKREAVEEVTLDYMPIPTKYLLSPNYTLSTPTKKNPLQIIDSQGIYCTQTRARTGMGCPTGV